MADPTPEEIAEFKAKKDAEQAEANKKSFFAMMDEWADERAKRQAPPKTNMPRPPSFLEGLFGSLPAPKSNDKTPENKPT